MQSLPKATDLTLPPNPLFGAAKPSQQTLFEQAMRDSLLRQITSHGLPAVVSVSLAVAEATIARGQDATVPYNSWISWVRRELTDAGFIVTERSCGYGFVGLYQVAKN